MDARFGHLAQGTVLGAFVVGAEKTPGGMARVYKGRHTRLEFEVAIKVIAPDTAVDVPEYRARLRREAMALARMSHPGVPAVHDLGETPDGHPYIVMEWIDGITLKDVITEDRPVPLPWAAALAAQIALVLTHAHGNGLIHRDLKPANVMVEPDGAVRVLDFGMAADLSPGHDTITRTTGHAGGTYAYMAPEQYHGKEVTPRTDLYALGLVLHEMLSGRPARPQASSMAESQEHLARGTCAPLLDVASSAPVPLAELVDAMLSPDPADRPADADEVADRLLPFAEGAVRLRRHWCGRSPALSWRHRSAPLLTRMAMAPAPAPASAHPVLGDEIAHADALGVAGRHDEALRAYRALRLRCAANGDVDGELRCLSGEADELSACGDQRGALALKRHTLVWYHQQRPEQVSVVVKLALVLHTAAVDAGSLAEVAPDLHRVLTALEAVHVAEPAVDRLRHTLRGV